METTPDLSSSEHEASSRRRRIALLVGVAAVLVAGFVAIALAAGGGGGGSNSNASAHLPGGGSGGHPGATDRASDGTAVTTTDGSRISAPTSSKGASSPTTARPGGTSSPTGPVQPSTPRTTAPRKIGGLTPSKPYTYTGSAPPPQAPPAIVQAYETAFRAECESIWSIATSDGKLWDPDEAQPRTPHTIDDCLKQMTPSSAAYAFDVNDARDTGTSDAMDAASGLTWFGTLQNTPGTQKWVDPSWSQ
jgi:hypothetical protein